MKLSRRQALALLPVVAGGLTAACGGSGTSRPVVNVRDHGAVGDGKADESAAIQAAVGALRSGSTLRFPSGTYRFAQPHPPGSAAIAISGMSDIEVEFADGAELVMDNLDHDTGFGTSHGIFVKGPASGITLRNVKIRWARPTTRSFGDGIRILGYPVGMSTAADGWDGAPAPVSNVHIRGCEIHSSPQAGAILIGTSDISVTDFRVQRTSADGLHFNACRKATVDNLSVSDNGDDGLALVTYFADTFSFDADAQTFAFPTLTDWSDADFTVTNVSVSGGRANGVRLAGANRVSLTGLTVTGKHAGAGVIADSASTVGPNSEWRYVAAQKIRLSKIAIDSCEFGIHMLARPSDNPDPRFTDFDIDVTDASARGCTNWAVRAESLTDQRVSGLRLESTTVEAAVTTGGNGGVGLENARDITMRTISITHAEPVILFSVVKTAKLSVDRLQLTITDSRTYDSAPIPCALFQDSDAVVNDMEVGWPQAPGTWVPLQFKQTGVDGDDLACSDPYRPSPVDIRTLTVSPGLVMTRVARC